MRKIVSSILVLICISIGIGMFLSSQEDEKVQIMPSLPAICAVPNSTQILFIPHRLPQTDLVYSQFINEIPLLSSVLRRLRRTNDSLGLLSELICALRFESEQLASLYILPQSPLNKSFVTCLFDEIKLGSKPKKVVKDDKLFYIYALQSGELLTYYEDSNVLCFSLSYRLVEEAVETLNSNKHDEFLHTLYDSTPQIDGNVLCLFRPNIMPLGRLGESSLEEFSTDPWVKSILDFSPKKIELKVSLPKVNNDLYLIQDEYFKMALEVPQDLISLSYFSKKEAKKIWENSISDAMSRFDQFWNQEVGHLLFDNMDSGVLIYGVNDTVTLSEPIISIPFVDSQVVAKQTARLIRENQWQVNRLLREETIDGYWRINVMPTPQGVKSLTKVNDDARLMYYYFREGEMLVAFNYFLLYNYLFADFSQVTSALTSICFTHLSPYTSLAFWGEIDNGIRVEDRSNLLVPSYLYKDDSKGISSVNIVCEKDSLGTRMSFLFEF